MTVLVYSACFGGRDDPHPQAAQLSVDQGVEWRLFTDSENDAPEPWQTWRTGPPHAHPNMAAKWFKTHPPPGGHDAAIWIDASMEVTSPRFVLDVLGSLDGSPLAAFAHPRRRSVYAEAEASLGPEGIGRYDRLPIGEQMAAYRAEGYPDGAGLWCGGLIAWAPTPAARELGLAWWDECVRWGFQDQLALPVVCWRAGYRPSTFPAPIIERHRRHSGGLENRWLRIHEHRPGTEHPA